MFHLDVAYFLTFLSVPSEIEVPPLPKTATIPEIIEAMKTPNIGLDFLTGYSYLPSHTFVVLDALVWLSNRLEGGMTQAKGLEFMEVGTTKLFLNVFILAQTLSS